jgi:CRISPR-associated protein Cas5h
MGQEIERIISFKLSGKFAHFSKFYTNSSSLSYLIPPRTAIAGLLASILKIPRDEYYELMSEENLKISVRIPRGLVIRKQTHSMNNLHSEYYKLLSTGKGKIQHSQCKLELLMSPPGGLIEYILYLGGSSTNQVITDIFNTLNAGSMGYGIYLGQRQFKAEISSLIDYKGSEICFYSEFHKVESICLKENVLDLEMFDEYKVLVEQIPVAFKKMMKKNMISREPISVKDVVFERNGKELKGKFKNCYKAGNNIISFY